MSYARSPGSSSSSSVGCGDDLCKDLQSPCAEVWPFGPTPPLQSAGDGVDHSVVRPPGRRLMQMQGLVHILATAIWGLRHAPHPLSNLRGTASIIHAPVMRRRRRAFIVQLCGDGGEHSFSSYAEGGVKAAPASAIIHCQVMRRPRRSFILRLCRISGVKSAEPHVHVNYSPVCQGE
jgi:hypothetical protein